VLFGLNEIDALWDLLVERLELGVPTLNAEICVYRELADFAIPVARLERFEQQEKVIDASPSIYDPA